MDISTIQAEIQNELHNIVNTLEKIQNELDDLNNLTKRNGTLDSAIKEGLKSSEDFFALSGCSLNDKDMDITELHTNIMDSTAGRTQNMTEEPSSQNNTTQ